MSTLRLKSTVICGSLSYEATERALLGRPTQARCHPTGMCLRNQAPEQALLV